MYPAEFGNSTLSVTVPLDEVDPAVHSLTRLLGGLGYTGLFDAEFKYDERDGLFKVLEVNARPWWQLEIAAASGLDLCSMAYRDALGLPFAGGREYAIGRTWVHPLPDLKAWWASRRAGTVAGPTPVRAFFGGANAIFAGDDPMPAVDEVTSRLRGTLRSPLKRLRAERPAPAPGPQRPAAAPRVSAGARRRRFRRAVSSLPGRPEPPSGRTRG
jgi:predicted ATP-grasp superfamily ATP-dependent carboligase